MLLFEVLLEQLKTRGLRHRPKANNVPTQPTCLPAVRVLNRLERVGETLRHALNILAEVAPDWLRVHVTPEWYDRYGSRMQNYHFPKAQSARDALGATIGEDGFSLLREIDAEVSLPWRARTLCYPDAPATLG
ncbi:MAG TPA: hypothetical protein VKR06_27560 [Ktedonosporobacter sp.]|nr:hypothetical protein [Ktedonosporobacter sp.]